MKKILSVFVFFLIALSVFAQSKLSPMTRNYLLEKEQQITPAELKFTNVKTFSGRDYVSAFITFTGEVNLSVLEKYGVEVQSVLTDMVTASVPVDALEALSEEDQIRYVEIATRVFPKLQIARGFGLVNDVHAGNAPLTRPYTGKDVVVGIVDFGFQYNHINFYDNQGNLRVKRVWNQNGYGACPDNYNGGVEYKTPSAIEAAAYDNRTNDVGHATHVAGIAAGSDFHNGNANYGIAYGSDLVFVSYNGSSDNVEILNGVKYVFDYATSVNKPAVVNLSLGSHSGPHDGTSAFDRGADQIQGAGRLMVGAAGNEGGDRFHIYKEFSDSDNIVKSFVMYNTSYYVSNIEIWGEVGTNYTVKLVMYNKTTRQLVDSTAEYSASTTFSRSLRLNGATGSISLSTGVNAINNKANTSISYQLSNLTSDYVIGVVVKATSGAVNIWADDHYSWLSSMYLNGWTMGDDVSSMGEIGGTGNRIITVGAYTSYAKAGFRQTVNKICTFSSKGPTPDGRIKPDITAPGSCLVSSIPNLSSVVNNATTPSQNNVNNKNYYYAYMQGTSMASPYVTGVLALWLEADPTLTPEKVREVFAGNSIVDKYTGSELPNNTWGYGKINAFGGLAGIISRATDVKEPATDCKFVVYPNPTSDECQVAFYSSDVNVRVELFDLMGHVVSSDLYPVVNAGDVHALNITSLSDGVYMVRVSGSVFNMTQRLVVNK